MMMKEKFIKRWPEKLKRIKIHHTMLEQKDLCEGQKNIQNEKGSNKFVHE
ncbi:hypothetical protein HPP92_016869 [Vanilla planifolia]|uniref:Uncharacterized protein n=1 Tax=Vanilla planifolia TaxID=51239 RepID=A0A835QPJ7_VANPL|nr:hypothetical protein HPP92_016869 [Vanilla planifolia]